MLKLIKNCPGKKPEGLKNLDPKPKGKTSAFLPNCAGENPEHFLILNKNFEFCSVQEFKKEFEEVRI